MRKTPKLNIKKGDTVQVLAGDDKGKKGRVIEIDKVKMKALVEGVNIISRHTKPSAQNTQGGIVKKEALVHLSNLSILDPKGGKPTRVGRKMVDGKSVRYAKKSGEVIK
jgi:large subunit ribosomal protein L24